jgi:hypothetical protein
MKVASLLFVLLLAFSAAAQNNGVSSNGDFQFDLAGASGAIQYDARLQGTSAKGQMTFTGATEISNEDVDGEGTAATALTNVTLTAKFDCVRVSGNRAAMSGPITASTVPAYVGARALLVVEDNGEGVNAEPDRFTWGMYRQSAATWIPSDAEVPGDNGASLTWFVTDAEREDDVAIPSQPLVAGAGSVDCKSFSFASYALEDVAHGAGNIQVRP